MPGENGSTIGTTYVPATADRAAATRQLILEFNNVWPGAALQPDDVRHVQWGRMPAKKTPPGARGQPPDRLDVLPSR